MKKLADIERVLNARRMVATEIGRRMVHYDFSRHRAIYHLLVDPDWQDTLRACRLIERKGDVTLPAVLEWFKQAEIEPHAKTHITDGLSPLQIELFRYLKRLMNPA